MKRICFISDTHCHHSKIQIEPCDILISTGDVSEKGPENQIRNFSFWFSKQPAKHKIFVPGNHDQEFKIIYPHSKQWITDYIPDVIIPYEESFVVENISFYGMFNNPKVMSEDELIYLEQKVPQNVDIFLTHRPLYNIMDGVVTTASPYKPVKQVGVAGIEEIVKRKNVKIFGFGHIHSANGVLRKDGITYINSALLEEFVRDIKYNKPIYVQFNTITKQFIVENESKITFNNYFNKQYMFTYPDIQQKRKYIALIEEYYDEKKDYQEIAVNKIEFLNGYLKKNRITAYNCVNCKQNGAVWNQIKQNVKQLLDDPNYLPIVVNQLDLFDENGRMKNLTIEMMNYFQSSKHVRLYNSFIPSFPKQGEIFSFIKRDRQWTNKQDFTGIRKHFAEFLMKFCTRQDLVCPHYQHCVGKCTICKMVGYNRFLTLYFS